MKLLCLFGVSSTHSSPFCLRHRHTNTNAATEPDVKARLELIAVYREEQLPSEAHEVLPFLDLISLLAREHENSCRAVIESGFIDVMVDICDHCSFEEAPTVVAAVQALIRIMLECQRGWDVVCTPQRLDLVWPRINPRIPLSPASMELIHRTPNDRKKIWMENLSNMIIDRLSEIAVVLSMTELQSDCEKDMFDICFDLLVFW